MNDTLTVVLPVHNEAATIEDVVSTWASSLACIEGLDFQLMLCEDGSTDGTKELIRDLVHRYPVLNASVNKRRGYGQAVRDGITNAPGNWVLCIDSDGQCRPANFLAFWQTKETHDFVIGYRKPRRDPFIRLIYSRLFFIYHRLLFPIRCMIQVVHTCLEENLPTLS